MKCETANKPWDWLIDTMGWMLNVLAWVAFVLVILIAITFAIGLIKYVVDQLRGKNGSNR